MKRLTVPMGNQKLTGLKCIGMIQLSSGSLGIVFEGNRIVDMRGSLLDQAEGVAELTAYQARMSQFMMPVDPAGKSQSTHAHKSRHSYDDQPAVIEAGGLEYRIPEFNMPWTPEPRERVRKDDRKVVHIDGWEQDPAEEGAWND